MFSGVARQAGATTGGLLVSEELAVNLLTQVGRELLLTQGEGGPGVSWGRIAAVFAVAGGLAVDCARQGHPEYVPALVGAVVELLEDDVAIWVAAKGGWVSGDWPLHVLVLDLDQLFKEIAKQSVESRRIRKRPATPWHRVTDFSLSSGS